MNITLTFKDIQSLSGTVALPASKSISNRVLIIHALAGANLPIENLADCDDTNTMRRLLLDGGNIFDVGHAGTAMRFLTAFLARTEGTWQLTGSERMKQRPIGLLVDALNQLGAHIEYAEKSGFPPLIIHGASMRGGEIEIPASVSSQYISALMMIAPCMKEGLKIKLKDRIVSNAYIDMTLCIMRRFGADITRDATTITIAPRPYTPVPYRVESDWSAASYFYELLAIAPEGTLHLAGLEPNSMQGDARQAQLWAKLGVSTTFREGEVILTKRPVPRVERLDYDFVEMPDLVQSFAVACCMLDIPFAFSGLETLRIKETDRIDALVNELGRLGYCLEPRGDSGLRWDGQKKAIVPPPVILTYNDHRMAMAFAPAALKHPGLVIAEKDVVTKSFPGYWEQLHNLLNR